MDTKNQIMQAAIHLFAKKGFASTTIREIAMAASVNIAMINYYFGSKELLLKSILVSGYEKFFQKSQIILIGRRTELDKLFALIDVYMEYIINQFEMSNLFFLTEQVKRNPVLHKLRRLNFMNFQKIIHAGQLEGVFQKEIDSRFFFQTIIGTIQQFIVNHLDQLKSFENHHWSSELVEQLDELKDYLKFLCRKVLLK